MTLQGEKKNLIFFAKVTPKRVWFRTKNAENFPKFFFYQVPNRNILKVTKYQHHMTVFKKVTVEIVRAWRNPPPPPPPGMNRVKKLF